MRHRHEHDDDDHILKVGERLRVPLTMMDSLDPIQRAVAHSTVRIVDGQGGTRGLHRPGFRIAADDARPRRRITEYDPKGRLRGYKEEEEEEDGTTDAMRARDNAYFDYERDLTSAYKNPVGFGGDPSITGAGERGPVGQREGGTSMLVYKENADNIVGNAPTHTESACRRDHRTMQQMMRDHQNKMTEIYDKLDHELSERWRRP
jgi:hypothetical protein